MPVIGIVGGVIAATVFAVIPWSQDQAASQALSSVATAESVAFAQSSGNGAGAYLATPAITATDGLGGSEGLLQTSDSVVVEISTDAGAFIAVSESDTGKSFYIFSDNPSTVLEETVAEAKLAADALLTGDAQKFEGITALPAV